MTVTHFARLGMGLSLCVAAACSAPANRGVSQDATPILAPPPTVSGGGGVGAGAEPAEGQLPSGEPVGPAADGAADGAVEVAVGPGSALPVPGERPAVGAPGPDRSASWPASVDGTAEVVVATVGGRPIGLPELVAKWVLRDPVGVRAILDDLVLSRIIVYEAAALQIELPEGAIEAAVKEELARYEKQALAFGASDLDTYVRKNLGMEPRTLLKNLEQDAAINLLAPRCVRAWLLSSDRREVRAITVKDTAGVDQVQARLARGDDFAGIARDLSTDPSAEEGGRMPPLVRGDIMLARAAFASDVGKIAGPLEDNGSLVFLKIEAAPEQLEGLWPEIGPAVEASLEQRRIEDPEFWQWKDAMSLRYQADVTPFLDLVQ